MYYSLPADVWKISCRASRRESKELAVCLKVGRLAMVSMKSRYKDTMAPTYLHPSCRRHGAEFYPVGHIFYHPECYHSNEHSNGAISNKCYWIVPSERPALWCIRNEHHIEKNEKGEVIKSLPEHIRLPWLIVLLNRLIVFHRWQR